MEGHSDVVSLLVEAHADINLPDEVMDFKIAVMFPPLIKLPIIRNLKIGLKLKLKSMQNLSHVGHNFLYVDGFQLFL